MENAFVTQLRLRVEDMVEDELELQGALSLPKEDVKAFVDAHLVCLADLIFEHFKDQI